MADASVNVTQTIPAARLRRLQDIAESIRSERQRLVRQHAGLKDVDAAQMQSFCQHYYASMDDEDLLHYPPAYLAHMALKHLALGHTRKTNEPLVMLFNSEPQMQHPAHAVLLLTTDDMPFLVDSISMTLARAGLNIELLAHPVLTLQRDGHGQYLGLGNGNSNGHARQIRTESWQRYELDRFLPPEKLQQLEAALRATLSDVRQAVSDWQAMRARVQHCCDGWSQVAPGVPHVELREAERFLHWLLDNHFTLLGAQEFVLHRGKQEDQLKPVADSALGLMRQRHVALPVAFRGELRRQARAPELLLITKSAALSTVHRAAHLDHISIKHIDAQGQVNGETRLLGLFTANVYSLNPRDVPLLRHKLEKVVDAIGHAPGSHNAKAVEHVIDAYPRDELFQSSVTDLVSNVRSIVALQERRRVRLLLRRDPFGRFYSCLLFLPRDRYNTQVRERIEGHLMAALGGTDVEAQVLMSDSLLARLHLLIRLKPQPESSTQPDPRLLEKDITHLIRTWADELWAALIHHVSEAQARILMDNYAQAFPAAYQAETSSSVAIEDLMQLQTLPDEPGAMDLRISHNAHDLHLRVIRRGEPLMLSNVLPVLENLELRVLSERPYEIEPQRAQSFWIQDFKLETSPDAKIDWASMATTFRHAFLAIWRTEVENDGFNRLIIKAGLDHTQANVLRAYGRYLLQTGAPFSQVYMEQTLSKHAGIADKLWQLFTTRFDPALKSTARERQLEPLQKQLEALLDAVVSPDEDRILRAYLTVINATVRSNYFQRSSGQRKPQLSFKIRSALIAHLPEPKPLFEIFVHSPRVEGIHLRMGPVARGGLRWSDRREDFRTEVLGLMKAQTVKNSVIVPVGAKGGFVPKQMPANASRDDIQREGIECYRSFVRGLLDITDNIVDGKTVLPSDVVRHDGDDPYLVVAADKGTASFSDIANGVAAEYHFWLGDAFASGGSAGYDHKKMAITARGAWECVKRHCREIDIDVDKQPFTAVGIGDMAGDVFGNGMLRSPHMKLLAAFNHQHIFLDPTPDAATSFKERQRLFDLPRSSWEDYNPKLISSGGGVYSRGAKRIDISASVKAMLGVTESSLTPQALVQAILRMPVDLLWNGGIGTYVKASVETHTQVGDRSNDAVRINGNELRCKVIGEGGNLGLTQLGRVEYAKTGGRLNTDFIDNSAGVDCSDHEVNIKILLSMVPDKQLNPTARRKLLAGMTEDVAKLVLRDNYLQSQALSLSEQVAASRLHEHAHLIRSLEQTYGLNRKLEGLPDAEEIELRAQQRRGLTRPELAVLLSYSKLALNKQLINSDIATDPYLAQELTRYFPAALTTRHGKVIGKHRLGKQIITTAITNSMVNRMGPSFALRAEQDTGADPARIARAYTIAREIFAMRSTWEAIEAHDSKLPAAEQYRLMNDSARLLRFVTYWLLHRHPDQLNIQQQVARLAPAIKRISEALPQPLPDHVATKASQANKSVLPLHAQVSEMLCAAPDIAEIALAEQLQENEVARVYFALDKLLSLAWLRTQVVALKAADRWQALARNTLRDQLYDLQRTLCTQILQGQLRTKPAARLTVWQASQTTRIVTCQQVLNEIRALAQVDFASLSVALQAVRNLSM